MKILHILSSLSPGGAEIYVLDLSKQMVRDGHVICIGYISNAKFKDRYSGYEDYFKAQLIQSGIKYAEFGHKCRILLMQGGLELCNIVNEFQPDIIHSHLYYGLIFKIFSFNRTPILYTHHNQKLGKGRYLYPVFNRIVSKYVGISNDCTTSLKSAGAQNVITIYNGVDVNRLTVKSTYVKNDCIIVQAVGSLIDQKNFQLLINAFKYNFLNYPEWNQNVKLKIAGDGPLRYQLQKQIDRAGLSKQIILLGNRKDIHKLLNEADLFVMSSRWEGLPISLLEAMITGLPVIVTDVGGCRDVVERCKAGLVVKPNNSKELASALACLIKNPARRLEMANSAKQKSQLFNIKTACDQHLAVYNSVL